MTSLKIYIIYQVTVIITQECMVQVKSVLNKMWHHIVVTNRKEQENAASTINSLIFKLPECPIWNNKRLIILDGKVGKTSWRVTETWFVLRWRGPVVVWSETVKWVCSNYSVCSNDTYSPCLSNLTHLFLFHCWKHWWFTLN